MNFTTKGTRLRGVPRERRTATSSSSAASPASCASCHGEDAFRPASKFDHDVDAAFSLKGAHARVPCAKCHATSQSAGGRAIVVYRPVPHTCEDCHGKRIPRLDRERKPMLKPAEPVPSDPRQPHSCSSARAAAVRRGAPGPGTGNPHGPLKDTCATCHGAEGWKPVKIARSFDHGRFRFPLEGAHVQAACRSLPPQPRLQRGRQPVHLVPPGRAPRGAR